MSVIERIDDLLLRRATEGLGPADAAELEALLEQAPQRDAERYDVAAALVSLAVHDPAERMPDRLVERLLRAVAPATPGRG